jgi:hypothetical protein
MFFSQVVHSRTFVNPGKRRQIKGVEKRLKAIAPAGFALIQPQHISGGAKPAGNLGGGGC